MDPLIKSQLLYQLSYAPSRIDLSCQRCDVKRARRASARPVVSFRRNAGNVDRIKNEVLERAMRFELTTPTLARLCSTPELRPRAPTSVTARM